MDSKPKNEWLLTWMHKYTHFFFIFYKTILSYTCNRSSICADSIHLVNYQISFNEIVGDLFIEKKNVFICERNTVKIC